MGKSIDEISAEYDLTLGDVHAALAYYFDHRSDIDRSIEQDNAFVDALRQGAKSPLKQKLQKHTDNGLFLFHQSDEEKSKDFRMG